MKNLETISGPAAATVKVRPAAEDQKQDEGTPSTGLPHSSLSAVLLERTAQYVLPLIYILFSVVYFAFYTYL